MLSTYAGNKVLDLLFRGVAFTAPSRVYVSLHTADPGASGASEVSTAAWPAYVRKDPANGGAVAGGFAAGSAKATTSLIDMLWPANNGAAQVTVTHIAIWDALTGGNCLFSAPLTASKVVGVTDELIIRAGSLGLTAV